MTIVKELAMKVESLAVSNPLLAVAAVVVILFLAFRRPLFLVSVIVLGLIAAGVFYIIIDASNVGTAKKERLIRSHSLPENVSELPGPRF